MAHEVPELDRACCAALQPALYENAAAVVHGTVGVLASQNAGEGARSAAARTLAAWLLASPDASAVSLMGPGALQC